MQRAGVAPRKTSRPTAEEQPGELDCQSRADEPSYEEEGLSRQGFWPFKHNYLSPLLVHFSAKPIRQKGDWSMLGTPKPLAGLPTSDKIGFRLNSA